MSDFYKFKNALQKQFDELSKHELFITDVDKDILWGTYLDSFPEGTNNIFRERREYDCQCCKQFISACGNVVAIINDKVHSIWDIKVGVKHYQIVADEMSALVKSELIKDVFLSSEKKLGTDFNHQETEDGPVIKWDHFYYELSNKFVSNNIGTELSAYRSSKEVFARGLDEITIEAAETVIELIEQKSLYRGEEHKPVVELFLEHKKAFDNISIDDEKDNYCWLNSVKLGSAARIRNTVIGTLLTDISEGMGLDKAVKQFESKVAPTNYKRPTAVITKSMIANAQKKVKELDIEDSLSRRYAITEDITINNVLFADRSSKKAMNVFDELTAEAPANIKNLDKVENVDIETFIETILPKSTNIELMFENKHINNLMSLIAPQYESKNILKWDNNFSWAYNGEVADYMKERVKAAGGRVDGVLRFTHSWNHKRKNNSLMDLHVFMPGCSYIHIKKEKEIHDNYPSGQRVGWNRRTDSRSGGVQDVDYVNEAPINYIPIENITFPDINGMKDGVYYLKIHNWQKRTRNKEGFKAEIEFNNNIYQYYYDKPLDHKEWVDVAKITLKNKVFSIEHLLPESMETKTIWDVSTNNFHKVKMIMNSPNHWDGNRTGNKHYFFMLENCLNPESARGFFNEFLKEDLREHRKVFEVLGSKMKVEKSDNQLSGLGFSSTQKNSVLCKVTGSFNRVIKINF